MSGDRAPVCIFQKKALKLFAHRSAYGNGNGSGSVRRFSVQKLLHQGNRDLSEFQIKVIQFLTNKFDDDMCICLNRQILVNDKIADLTADLRAPTMLGKNVTAHFGALEVI